MRMEIMSVICPAGVEPGDTVVIVTEWGEEMEVAVPKGISPGDAFDVPCFRPHADGPGDSNAVGEAAGPALGTSRDSEEDFSEEEEEEEEGGSADEPSGRPDEPASSKEPKQEAGPLDSEEEFSEEEEAGVEEETKCSEGTLAVSMPLSPQPSGFGGKSTMAHAMVSPEVKIRAQTSSESPGSLKGVDTMEIMTIECPDQTVRHPELKLKIPA